MLYCTIQCPQRVNECQTLKTASKLGQKANRAENLKSRAFKLKVLRNPHLRICRKTSAETNRYHWPPQRVQWQNSHRDQRYISRINKQTQSKETLSICNPQQNPSNPQEIQSVLHIRATTPKDQSNQLRGLSLSSRWQQETHVDSDLRLVLITPVSHCELARAVGVEIYAGDL